MATKNQNLQKASKLVAQAGRHIDRFELDAATSCYRRALKIQPDNQQALEAYGEHLVCLGEPDKARAVLLKAIQLYPNTGSSKYFNLAQISDMAENALKYHRKALEVLLHERELVQKQKLKGDLEEIKTNLCAGYCSFAELYLVRNFGTEGECETMILRGLQEDPNHYELLQTLASLRIEQNRQEEALDALKKSHTAWSSKELSEWPNFAFCHNAAKMFVELKQYQTASEILESMLEIDDQYAEVWYWLALAYSYFDLAAAISTLDTTKQLMTTLEEPDAELQEDINKLERRIVELKAKLSPQELKELEEELQADGEGEGEAGGEDADDGGDDDMGET